MTTTSSPECNPHPDAPHGFNRNASHTEDRYVCDCEGWEPSTSTAGARQPSPIGMRDAGYVDSAPLLTEVEFFWQNRPTEAVRALQDVMAERHRQMMVEGWTAKHDDEHVNGGMAAAAACYALQSLPNRKGWDFFNVIWPWTGWATHWFKPKDKRRDLVRAGALILAEIERLDRATPTPSGEKQS